MSGSIDPVATGRYRGLAERVRRASAPRGSDRPSDVVAEGLRLLERALRAGLRVDAVVVSSRFVEDDDPRVEEVRDRLLASGAHLSIAPRDVVGELTAGRGEGEAVGLVELPPEPTLPALVAPEGDDGPRPIVLVGVDVEDPGNVGALVRTAHAAGARAYVGLGLGDPFHPRAVRVSRGSVFKLPVVRRASIDTGLDTLRSFGCAVVAAVCDGGVPLPDLELPDSRGALAVVVGNEAVGLSGSVSGRVDAGFTIPMAPGIDSFSVHAAAAIALYAIREKCVDRVSEG